MTRKRLTDLLREESQEPQEPESPTAPPPLEPEPTDYPVGDQPQEHGEKTSQRPTIAQLRLQLTTAEQRIQELEQALAIAQQDNGRLAAANLELAAENQALKQAAEHRSPAPMARTAPVPPRAPQRPIGSAARQNQVNNQNIGYID